MARIAAVLAGAWLALWKVGLRGSCGPALVGSDGALCRSYTERCTAPGAVAVRWTADVSPARGRLRITRCSTAPRRCCRLAQHAAALRILDPLCRFLQLQPGKLADLTYRKLHIARARFRQVIRHLFVDQCPLCFAAGRETVALAPLEARKHLDRVDAGLLAQFAERGLQQR